MKTFTELIEELKPKGNYVSIGVDAFPHVEWLKGAKNIDPSTAHVTVMYSKETNIPIDEVNDVAVKHLPNVISAIPIGLAKFDSQEDDTLCCLVLKIQSDDLVQCHAALSDYGLTHSYPEFSPHVTLAYDIPKVEADEHISTIDPSSFGEIKLSGIKSTHIDSNWSSKLKVD